MCVCFVCTYYTELISIFVVKHLNSYVNIGIIWNK